MSVMYRRLVIYGLLAVAWLLIAGWQVVEHQRVSESTRRGLASRAHDLAAALSVVIRSQGRVAVIPKPRLEAALDELVSSAELESVLLLNASGDVAASAGRPMTVDVSTLLRTHEYWTRDAASFTNLVALGPGTEGAEGTAAILPLEAPPDGDGRGPHGGLNEPRTPEDFLRNPILDSVLDAAQRQTLAGMMGDTPLTAQQVNLILGLFREGVLDEHRAETLRRTLAGRPLDRAMIEEMLMIAAASMPRPPGPSPDSFGRSPSPPHPPHDQPPWMGKEGHGRRGPPPEQPPWMSKDEYDRLVQEHGVHWFLVTIPTAALRAETARDLRLRAIVLGVALLASLALGLAWRTFERSSNLEIQLVRARETARRLEELNITAAGLVHETKNPLNLIRGLAQMIRREKDVSNATRETAVRITDETDRVTGRLKQFLGYARPVQPRPQRLDLNALVEGMFEILACDREDKSVTFELNGPPLHAHADENMLRQVLFNLLLNAIQAVPNGGHVEVRVAKETDKSASIEVRDNGPGVPEKDREEVFRPYFTTSANGTGLGLAVVRQIALAHHWEVACAPNEDGAVFRVRGIARAPQAGQGANHA